MNTDDFRVIDTQTAWDESRQAFITFDGCEELIDGRWEGFISIRDVRRLQDVPETEIN